MTKQVQRRRGSSTQHTGFTGADGEISVNTTNKSVHVHDGATAGGFEAARADLDNVDSTANLSINNLTVSGTVDGRDVAADGTKLDGIEAGATANQTGAEIKLAYEAEANTNAFTDAEKTKLTGIEASADVTDATNVAAAGAAMLTGANFTGNVDVTGSVTANGVHSEYNGVSDNITTSPTASGVQIGSFTNGFSAVEIAGTSGGFIDFSSADGTDFDGRILYVHSNDSMQFYTAANTTERMRIDSSGNVGIGGSPSQKLDVYAGGKLYLRRPDNATGTLIYDDGVGTVIDAANNTPIRFAGVGVEGMRYHNGKLAIGTSAPSGAKLEIFTGSTSTDGLKINRFGSGVYYSTLRQDSHGLAIRVGDGSTIAERVAITPNGITFNGDTAAANALDDYEEGVWYPVLNGSTSGTFAGVGSYVKIGKTVLLSCTFNAIGTGISGNLQITGLPFTINPSGSLDMYVPLQFFNLNWDNNAKAVYGFVGDAGTAMVPYYSQDSSASTIIQGSHLGTQTYLRFVQTFETA